MIVNYENTTLHNEDNDIKVDEQGKYLIYFFSPMCGPCRNLAPKIDIISEENPDLVIVKVDIMDDPEIPTKYGVRGVPAMIKFNHAAPVDSQIGDIRNKDELTEWIKK